MDLVCGILNGGGLNLPARANRGAPCHKKLQAYPTRHKSMLQISTYQLRRLSTSTSSLWSETDRLAFLVARRIQQFERLRQIMWNRATELEDAGDSTRAQWMYSRFGTMHSKAFNRLTAMQDRHINRYRLLS